MNIKVLIKYALLFLISIGLAACNHDENGFQGTIVAANTPGVISGTTTGSISGTDTVATGTLSVTDPDAGEAAFQTQTDDAQTYGSFSITSGGQWTYTLDRASDAFVALNGGEEVTETITVATAGQTTQNIIITLTGVNDPAVFGSGDGVNSASMQSNNGDPETGTLTLTDPDTTSDTILVQTNTASSYGTFSIAADGSWTYTLDTNNSAVLLLLPGAGDLTDVIPVSTADGLMTNVTITISPAPVTNTPATFAGDTTGSIKVGDMETTGTVTVTDPDAGENMMVGQTNAAQTYGSFSIGTDGAWVYVLDNSNTAVQGLATGATLTDTINIASDDDTSSTVVITINGPDAPTGGNKFAEIIDTMGSNNGNDTGELRYALGNDGPLAAGRLQAKIKRLDDSLGDGDAFITLFNSGTNNAGAILDLRIRDNNFGIRDSAADATAASTLPHKLDEFMDVVITWDYAGNTNAAPQVTVEVDGTSIGPFTTTNSPFGGVTHVAFRFGDNGGARPATAIFSVDDIAIFSDTAGATTPVFSDDFESYSIGDSLDTDNPASPYHSNTSEATVGGTEGVAGGPGTPGNKIAEIIDTMGSNNGNDTGELRYALGGNGPLAAGRVQASIKRLDDTLGDGDAFITLFNSGTNNAGAILDLRIRDNNFGVRDSAADATAASTLAHKLDEFMNVVITWDYAGNTNAAPQVTVEVDGTSIGPFTTTNSPFGGVTHVAFRFGDNGGARPATGIFSVDDLAIFSDTAGATTPVFSDDFESYADGDSLDTDNTASPYNGSTSEATVAVEQ